MKEKEITVRSKTVEEAIEEALKSLGLAKDQAEIEVLEEPKKALFGMFGGKPASVRVREKKDPIGSTVTYLKAILSKMSVPSTVEVKKKSEREYTFQLSGDKVALAIGKRGQTLNSLQTLINLFANQQSEKIFHIILDAEEYRSRREVALQNLAYRMADKVAKTKKSVKLEPMPSYERKVIHAALQNNEFVKTLSVGEDPYRSIKIELK
ncbi:protein jag [Pullulanibacillus sp. KACC 23026]|uniref:RNA-binding cell elongation regulator Jag/EloR n=1 Tax=Pullulanibacillus sp. KACC 23026 TaxID=3028315 RepID=UPI0023B15039|nr:RNA-binding cell elongation regulator Jag/EloR [Pullulanibacillus sp. KACC 23026]WEG12786.1 protein jag [Pullulanibacillus sp. KACC 23026]